MQSLASIEFSPQIPPSNSNTGSTRKRDLAYQAYRTTTGICVLCISLHHTSEMYLNSAHTAYIVYPAHDEAETQVNSEYAIPTDLQDTSIYIRAVVRDWHLPKGENRIVPYIHSWLKWISYTKRNTKNLAYQHTKINDVALWYVTQQLLGYRWDLGWNGLLFIA